VSTNAGTSTQGRFLWRCLARNGNSPRSSQTGSRCNNRTVESHKGVSARALRRISIALLVPAWILIPVMFALGLSWKWFGIPVVVAIVGQQFSIFASRRRRAERRAESISGA
jgi:hypothetical protein